MKRLFHYIFLDADIEKLNARQVEEHLAYLNKILLQVNAASESDILFSVKARLDQRLQKLSETETKPDSYPETSSPASGISGKGAGYE